MWAKKRVQLVAPPATGFLIIKMNNNFFTRFTVLIKDRDARNRVAVFGSGDFMGKKGAHPHDDPDLGDEGKNTGLRIIPCRA